MSTLNKIISSDVKHGDTELSHINYLDGWRGLAILFVLQDHFFTLTKIDTGTFGVEVFFVLSGFLMSRILYEKRVPLKVFYKRRFSRVFPLFILFVTVIYSLAYLFDKEESQYFINTLLFIRTYFPSDPGIWNTGIPIGHLWSLNVEEHSYLLLSTLTLIAFAYKKETYILIALGIVTVVIHYYYTGLSEYKHHPYELQTEAAAGFIFLSAGYYLIRDKFAALVKPWMPISAFIAAMLCHATFAPWYACWLFAPFLLAFSINHIDLSPKALLSALSYAPLRLIGIWSFSIYIWQQPFYLYAAKYGILLPGANIVFMLTSILAGYMSFKLYENPARTWLNRQW